MSFLSTTSRVVGWFARLPLPWPISRITVGIFAWWYGIDTAAADKPIGAYNSIGAFFIRDLKPELRPIGGGLVSPVDGTIRSIERVNNGELIQVKAIKYSLASLLGDAELAAEFSGAHCWNMYLSPQDAHHIFAPVSGKITTTIHIPGTLWPVNDWALNNVPQLFCVNERVVTVIESDLGKIVLVSVGALNVGMITLHYTSLTTNLCKRVATNKIPHQPAPAVTRGEKIATFNMGSSVILLTKAEALEPQKLYGKIRYGATLSKNS